MSTFTRKELQDLREKARVQSEIVGLTPSWQRAYLRVADAADHLEAMIVRIESYGIDASEIW